MQNVIKRFSNQGFIQGQPLANQTSKPTTFSTRRRSSLDCGTHKLDSCGRSLSAFCWGMRASRAQRSNLQPNQVKTLPKASFSQESGAPKAHRKRRQVQDTKGATLEGSRQRPSSTYKKAPWAIRIHKCKWRRMNDPTRLKPVSAPPRSKVAAIVMEPSVIENETGITLLTFSYLH